MGARPVDEKETPVQERAETPAARLITEVAGYVGATAALVSAFAFLALIEADETGVFAAFAAATGVLVGGGFLIGRTSVDAYQRLRSVLWFGSVFALSLALEALFVGVLDLVDDQSSAQTVTLLTGAVVAVSAFFLWLRSQRALQLLALHLALLGVVTAIVYTTADPLTGPGGGVVGVVLWLFGVVWIGVSAGGLAPAPVQTALVLGGLTALAGPYAAAAPSDLGYPVSLGGADLWSLATAVGLLWLGTTRGLRGLQGVAIAGVLVGTGTILTDLVSTKATAAVALVIGAALLAAALVQIRHLAGQQVPTPPLLPPPPPA